MAATKKQQIKAALKQLRIAPRKVRLLADAIRGLSVKQADQRLLFMQQKGAEPLRKLLLSAAANAEHNFQLSREHLFIAEIMVDEGTKLKRWQPRAMGRATPILKRSSHVTMMIEDRSPEPVAKNSAAKKVPAKKSTAKKKSTS